MRRLAALALALTLAGCAGLRPPGCPAGQAPVRTAQLFFGQNVGDAPGVTEGDFRRFVDEELTPRFPDGLTILDDHGQWRGASRSLIHEPGKLVMLVLPKGAQGEQRIEAARKAYMTRFHQESVLLVTAPACVAF